MYQKVIRLNSLLFQDIKPITKEVAQQYKKSN